jgi:hypothetical protein
MGGGIAGNQVKGPLSLNLNATGSGDSQADLMRSLNGNGNVDGSVMIIGKMEQQVGSALLGVLGSQVKQVQGITSAVNGILSSYTGVDNKLDGTFDIKQGVLNTQDFAFVNPKCARHGQGRLRHRRLGDEHAGRPVRPGCAASLHERHRAGRSDDADAARSRPTARRVRPA